MMTKKAESASTNTIRLHRVLRAPPERVYRAFLDAEAKVKWLPPNGFTGKVHHMDAKVGGTYKMSFTNFTTGKSHSFGGTYLELTPNDHIEKSIVRHRIERGARRCARRHSGRGLLPWLAGIAYSAGEACRGGDPRVKTDQNIKLEIRRVIKAPRDRVYAAWTDPAQMKKWFGPENVVTRDLVADVRVGGKYRWDITNAEGEEMTARGEYCELERNKKIVFTWQWDDDEAWKNHTSIVTVELSDRDAGTELRLTHAQLPNEESRDSHTEGWNSALNKLEGFVSRT